MTFPETMDCAAILLAFGLTGRQAARTLCDEYGAGNEDAIKAVHDARAAMTKPPTREWTVVVTYTAGLFHKTEQVRVLNVQATDPDDAIAQVRRRFSYDARVESITTSGK
jgi:hypothetical protein